MSPHIAIVVPAFNAERFLDATLRSVQSQSFVDWECIIVDDFSKDRTVKIAGEWAQRDPRFRVVQRALNGGVATTRNDGLHCIRRESHYVTFLDHDDLWYPNTLSSLLQAMVLNPNWSAVVGKCVLIDHTGTRVSDAELETRCFVRLEFVPGAIRNTQATSPVEFRHIVLHTPIMTPGMALIRLRAINAVMEGDNAFDQSLAPCDDWDLWVRLTRVGPIGLSDTIALAYRRHATNASRKVFRMGAAARRFRCKTHLCSELRSSENMSRAHTRCGGGNLPERGPSSR